MIVDAKLSISKDTTRKDIKDTIEINTGFKVKSIKMPLKPGAGRRRGNKWELDFCKQLSLWWSGGRDDKVFKRAGSESTKANGAIFGDVYSVKPEGAPLISKIAIELKAVKESRAETASLLCGKSKMFSEFWDQAVRQANLGKRHPILVVKIDRYCPLVFNLIPTIGKIRLYADSSRLVPVCTLDDWFSMSVEEFDNCDVFHQMLSKLL